jgi:hypothetical protein
MRTGEVGTIRILVLANRQVQAHARMRDDVGALCRLEVVRATEEEARRTQTGSPGSKGPGRGTRRRPGRRKSWTPRTWRCRCGRRAPSPGRRPSELRHRADAPPSRPRTGAWSTRRRRSSRDGKSSPCRSVGIFRLKSPAVVDRVRGLVPLRWAVRSSVRSNGPAPMNAVASASISSW